jgi:hypothetical protein
MYAVEGWSSYADEFQELTSEFHLAGHSEYYDSDIRPGAERDEVVVPESLPELLRIFAGLKPEPRRQYLRAATWIQMSDRAWDISTSYWFTGRVSAIETFVQADKSEVCEHCGSILGITRAFKAVLEKYAPRLDKQARDSIYDYRSRLSHGEMLSRPDEKPWAFAATSSVVERSAQDSLVRAARDVMVNWLLDQETKPVAEAI